MYFHAADSILTSGCSVISSQIWNKIFIVLAIPRRCILIPQLISRKQSRYIYISGSQNRDEGTLGSMIVTRWHRWRFGWRCHLFWRWLFAPDLSWSTRSFVAPACPWILRWVILARKAVVSQIVIKHCQVSLYRSFRFSMPRKFNTLLLLFSDLCTRFHDQVLRFISCGLQIPSFAHFDNIHGKAHVCLF